MENEDRPAGGGSSPYPELAVTRTFDPTGHPSTTLLAVYGPGKGKEGLEMNQRENFWLSMSPAGASFSALEQMARSKSQRRQRVRRLHRLALRLAALLGQG